MKQRIINYLLRNFARVIIPDDVISDVKDPKTGASSIYLGSQKITDAEVRSLVAEAKALESMRLWSIINETIRQRAFEKGWNSSTTMEQLNTAKTMYHVLDVQNSIVKIIRRKESP